MREHLFTYIRVQRVCCRCFIYTTGRRSHTSTHPHNLYIYFYTIGTQYKKKAKKNPLQFMLCKDCQIYKIFYVSIEVISKC